MTSVCQLLLQSLKGFKHEILLTTYEKTWERDLIRVLNERTPIEEFVFPAAPESTAPDCDSPTGASSPQPQPDPSPVTAPTS